MSSRIVLALGLAMLISSACSSTTPRNDAGDFGDDGDDSSGSKGDKGNGGSIGSPVSSTPDSGTTTTPNPGSTASTCQTPRLLGSIKGDVTGPSLSTKGTCSEWIQVRATEEGSSGDPMKLTVTLVPDSNIDFDLYVYVGSDSNQVECGTAAAQSTQPGTAIDVASYQWGEAGIPNGKSDDRFVSIEVRVKNAKDCTPGASDGGTTFSNWTLLVEGDK